MLFCVNTSAVLNNYIFTRGNKFFELSNHLGNVLATISDKKTGIDTNNDGQIDFYISDVVTANDYYPFGSLMPGRKYSTGNVYRYGFNGKEKSSEIAGDDYDFGSRVIDGRLGRWLSVDPLQSKYPSLSCYQFAANSPLNAYDPDGRLIIFINGLWGWPNQVGGGGSQDYWENSQKTWVSSAQQQIGDFKQPRFYDGSLGGTRGLALGSSAHLANKRIEAGRHAGFRDAATIIGNLDKGETIKIITNSMGAAFERGFTQGLLKYVAGENVKIAKANENLDVQILGLKFENATLHNQIKTEDRGVPFNTQYTDQEKTVLGKIKNNNTKIAQLEASKKNLIDVKIEFVVDLSSHQIDYPDPNAQKSYYAVTDPSNLNWAESEVVDQREIKGATEIVNPNGAHSMTHHHSTGMDPKKLPKAKSVTGHP